MHGDVSEGHSFTLTAPDGMVFSSVEFASYGTPTGTGGNYVQGNCHASDSVTIVSNSALNQTAVTLEASNNIFGDPCGGTVKRLAVSLGLSLITPYVPITATGGQLEDVTVDGVTYRTHTFTTLGTDTFTVTDPGTSGEIEYVVVGGGGGGGRSGPHGAGGGGGGGEVRTGTLVLTSGSFQVTVGAGGTGVDNTATNHVTGEMGGDSAFHTVAVWGGGGGGGGSSVVATTRATGGGAGATSGAGMTGASGTESRGFGGGDSLTARGGGGGGARGSGVTAQTAGGGSGGAGLTLHISGQSVAYGGGGGGGCELTGCIAGAGVDGGGSGGAMSATGLPGVPATGGGGGGAGGHSQNGGGANGGSGIVIIRYRLSPPA
jgi:hypothetical protein